MTGIPPREATRCRRIRLQCTGPDKGSCRNYIAKGIINNNEVKNKY